MLKTKSMIRNYEELRERKFLKIKNYILPTSMFDCNPSIDTS